MPTDKFGEPAGTLNSYVEPGPGVPRPLPPVNWSWKTAEPWFRLISVRTTIGTTLVRPIGAAESLDGLVTDGVTSGAARAEASGANPEPPLSGTTTSASAVSPAELDAGTVTCTVALPPAGTIISAGDAVPPSELPRSMAVKTTVPE